jgi:cell fate (sporulation/competence/biofilm development) regulator YlbF (YheA/YmcA/DUF963 family)
MSKLTDKANELGLLIKEEPSFIKYEEKKKKHDDDKELQGMISEFNLIRMNLNSEMGKEDRDDAKTEDIQKMLEKQYADIMENSSMKEYMEARQDFEELVNSVYGIINYHITGQEPGCDTSKCSSCGGGCGH